jgi:hypothetical protein
MNRQRRKVKQRRQLERTGNERLEKETRKLVNKANARLDSLQRRYKKGTWASKKLANRLSSSNLKAWSKSGKIKIKKNANKTQMLAINKAVNQFLKSSTSTKKGIGIVREKTIESLRASLSTEDVDLSYEDAETFYEMFGSDDFQSIADKIGASSLQAVIEDATEENDSENGFIQRLEMYGGVMMNDLDIRDAAKRLYEKYVL